MIKPHVLDWRTRKIIKILLFVAGLIADDDKLRTEIKYLANSLESSSEL